MRAYNLALTLALLALGGCQSQNDDVFVDHSWVHLAAVPDQPAAAYFRLTGGSKDETLFAVHADTILKSELHESMVGMAGMSTMKPLAYVIIPAHQQVIFAPGGKHVMLFGVDPTVKPGTPMHLSFVFKSGLKLADDAVVIAAGGQAPKF